MENIKTILITGGGSGGHVSVASGLIEGIKRKYPALYKNLVYVGGDLGMVGEEYGNSIEQRKFKNSEFKVRYIRAGKLQRSFSLSSVKLLLRTVLGVIDSFKILNEEKPDLIFSTGGFVSVPVCLVGWIKNIPIYLHEQTATVGLANKIVSKFAKKIYISFESSQKYFKNRNVKLVGNIVREAVTNFDISKVDSNIKNIATNNTRYPLIYISGGGLGSHIINQKILSEIEQILTGYRVILQTGYNQNYKDYERAIKIKDKLPKNKQNMFLPIKFINEESIGYVYHNIDFFIGRAGANTVYEIGLLQKPSLFIPIPWVANNEQFENAKVLQDLGLSEILDEDIFKKADIKNRIDLYIDKLPRPELNREKLKEKFPNNAVDEVLNELYTLTV
jgi:UDP-N-acetylglucosamine--N-acetylmuramyl-(pentapeptide) pyrophosphoryl-undecaprenol N-acetylglucosamine transferase